jgi:CHAT domain-containing protein
MERGDLKLGRQRLSEALAVVDSLYDKTSYRRRYFIYMISLANFGLGKLDQARDQGREELRLEYLRWQKLASVATERQRQAARETLHPFDLPATLNDGELLAVATLLLKGVVLDADLRDRRFASAAMQDERLSAKWTRLETVRERLRSRELTEALGIENTAEAIADNQELDKLVRDFREAASIPAASTLSPDNAIAKVQAVLPDNAVLVEFVRYKKWLKASKGEERYAAAVISKTTEPKYVDFGSARILDDLINRFRQLAGTDLKESATKHQIENTDKELRRVSQALYHAVAEPIQAASPTGTQEVIICPDSQLHFLSFYVLMAPDGRFWGDRVRLSFVSTGRDLLLPEVEPVPSISKNAVLFGQPAYGMPTYAIPHPDPMRAAMSENPSEPENYELSGSGVEVDDLQDEFTSFGWNCRTSCSWDASEAALRLVHRPDILHLATHGFFLPEIPSNAQPSTGVALERVRNPMQRSGLLLAGASSTLKLWREHKRADERSDGILTADEVASLDLQGTTLVTLSACKTALGEAPSGEGVLGLKRAFLIAGARHLVITLWSITDKEDTRDIMQEFYRNLLSGAKPVEALRTAQRSALARLLSQRGLQHAINRAGSFVFLGR